MTLHSLQILSEWFGRSVICSCVKLSYDHAQSMIEAPDKMFSAEELPPVDPTHPIDEIHQAVLNLHSIAKNLRAQRFSGGALRLDQVSLNILRCLFNVLYTGANQRCQEESLILPNSQLIGGFSKGPYSVECSFVNRKFMTSACKITSLRYVYSADAFCPKRFTISCFSCNLSCDKLEQSDDFK